ncbi:MAG: DinB family protein [Armatimonadetes bacterium]|nr:DinB family protein [Armatimonadota bacterium]NOG92069.1 DinB family protein [Armatimonadota bacterium]
MSTDLLRQLAVGWEYAYLHEDWTTPLSELLDGLDAAAALRHPSGESRSIWAIVLHLSVWNENIVTRVLTGENADPEEGAWPPLPPDPDDTAWEAAKIRLADSFAAVAHMLQTVTYAQIQDSPYGLPDLLCRYVHAGYHVGQIVKLRECLRV